jgi:hypothetical protein
VHRKRTVRASHGISGALTLLINAVIAYSTWKLHQALERYLDRLLPPFPQKRAAGAK